MILHHEIEKLKKKLLELGAIVEERVDIAVKSIMNRDKAMARAVIEGDADIDRMEVNLEEECLKVLALHQPVAVDLRMIITILKMNNDLERIADLAVNIAERAMTLIDQVEIDFPYDLPHMSKLVQKMLQQSLDALVNYDADMAVEVCISDDAVDNIHSNVFHKVEEIIINNPKDIKLLLMFLSVSRYLERMADHATNIAEDVIYMIKGNIVRHRGKSC